SFDPPFLRPPPPRLHFRSTSLRPPPPAFSSDPDFLWPPPIHLPSHPLHRGEGNSCSCSIFKGTSVCKDPSSTLILFTSALIESAFPPDNTSIWRDWVC
ncbi:hypothetical protein LINPERPRIM_LOCUS1894, partial [Linum perenne]